MPYIQLYYIVGHKKEIDVQCICIYTIKVSKRVARRSQGNPKDQQQQQTTTATTATTTTVCRTMHYCVALCFLARVKFQRHQQKRRAKKKEEIKSINNKKQREKY